MKGVDMQIKPAVLVKQHFKIIFGFQNSSIVLSLGLNHAFHNKPAQLLNQKSSMASSKMFERNGCLDSSRCNSTPEDFH
jgi:hypothetical protein